MVSPIDTPAAEQAAAEQAAASLPGRNLPIATKLVGGVTLLVVLVVTLFSVMDGLAQRKLYRGISEREREHGEALVESRGSATTRRLAAALAPAVAENAFSYAKEVVDTAAKEEPNALYVTVIGDKGVIVVDSRPGKQGQRLADPIDRRISGTPATRRVSSGGKSAMLFSAPMAQQGSLLGELRVVYSLTFLERKLTALSRASDEALRNLVLRGLAVAGLCILVGVLLAIPLSLSITKPVRSLSQVAERVSRGDLKARAEVRSSDEIGRLGAVFNEMTEAIELALTHTADKVRMEKELEVARAVQESLVPDQRPIDLGPFELAGFYRPASTCGGDWWDYFVIGDRLWVTIGDVSGHGVPSALITASAKSACNVMRQVLGAELSIEALMRTMNYVIYSGGERRLGMSMLLTVINLKTGEVTVANAGHPMPNIVRKDGDRIKIRSISARGGRLGDGPEWKHREKTDRLKPGDLMLWYTDGLIEGKNAEGQQYGKKRLRNTLERHLTSPMAQARDQVAAGAFEYFGDEPVDDDITFVVGRMK